MSDETPTNHIVRFGIFEADLVARELRKRGVRVKIQEQPFRLLAVLLDKPGQIVTREEVQQELWPEETFVDFEKSLNTAAQKVRQALGDSAESPRFFETIPRVGYRFLAPVRGAVSVEGDSPSDGATEQASRRPLDLSRFVMGKLMAATVVLVGLGYWLGQTESSVPALELTKFTLAPELPAATPGISEISPSPDGRYIAFLDGPGPYEAFGETLQLVVWDGRKDEYRVLGSGGRLFWSPDSRQIGVVKRDAVLAIDVDSGATRTLVNLPERPGGAWSWGGGAWSSDGRSIVISSFGPSQGLYEIDTSDTPQERLVQLPGQKASPGERIHSPSFLPPLLNRKALIYAVGGSYRQSSSRIEVQNLETGATQVLVSDASLLANPIYSPDGYVIYEQRGRALWAVPFSLERLEATGKPFLIAEDASQPGITANGTLIYGKHPPLGPTQLGWRDRQGNKLGVIGQPEEGLAIPVLSPDATEVVAQVMKNGVPDVWIHEVRRPVKRRVTFSGGSRPTWRRPGSQVTFNKDGDIWIVPADGRGEPQILFDAPPGAPGNFGFEWSRDGKYLAGSGGSFIFYLRQKSDGEGWDRIVLEDNSHDRVGPDLSPDGLYIAYESLESGRPEVYVRPFPEGGWKKQVSTDGGGKPRWQSEGEIFYVDGAGALMVVPVSAAREFTPGIPTRLFHEEGLFGGRGQTYDVTSDGQRIVVVEGRQTPWPREIQVVRNWYEEFRDQEH